MLHHGLRQASSHFLKAETDQKVRGVGYVRGGDSRFYFLDLTGQVNVTKISHRLWRGQPIRPICFHIEPLHTCSFYELAMKDAGPLIGTFSGPAEGRFQDEYAAYYSCYPNGLDTGRENDRHWPRPTENRPCGYLGVFIKLGAKVE